MSDVIYEAWMECVVAMGVCLCVGLALCVVLYLTNCKLEHICRSSAGGSHD